MKKSGKIFCIILVVVVIGILGACYFSQSDWCGTDGWQGEYNIDSVTMNGVEGMECICSKNTRIMYSYAITSGGAELKITRDINGKDVVKSVVATEGNSDGIITFDNDKPEKLYLHETAISRDSEYYSEVNTEVKRTKWRQFLLRMAFKYGIDEEKYGMDEW